MHGKVVLITGAARGIGAAAARACAARGATLSLVGLEPAELEARAAELGPQAAAFEADVTDWGALGAAVEETVHRFGGIDAVVANAGIAAGGPIAEADVEAFERTIEVNLLGVWRTVRAALPHVIERRGYVLPVASLAAAAWAPGLAPYSMSKAGVEAFARTLHLETAHLGVTTGVAYFSWIDTDMVRSADAMLGDVFPRNRLKGPLAKTYPVSAAGEAIAVGIAERRRTVIVPGWARAILLARTLLRPLTELDFLRQAEEWHRQIDERRAAVGEEALAPVGPGGAAAMGARGERAPAGS
jgi:NAD(P)-dependent dehydrogenase (short-subunit alcohol dehydrogenase family)